MLASIDVAFALLGTASLALLLAWRVGRGECRGRPRPLFLGPPVPRPRFAWLLAAAGAWLVAEGLADLIDDSAARVWLQRAAWLAALATPVALLLSALEGTSGWRLGAALAAVAAACLPMTAVVLGWGPGTELGPGALLRDWIGETGARPATALPAREALDRAPWQAIHAAFSGLCVAAALPLMLRRYAGRWRIRVGELALLAFAVAAPFAGALLGGPRAGDARATGLAASVLLLAWIFEARRQQGLLQMAQGAALDAFDQGVVVVDRDLRILEASPRARELLDLPDTRSGWSRVTPSCPQLLRLLRDPALERGEFTLRSAPSRSRHFQVRVSAPQGRRWPLGMRVVAVREETQRKEVDQRLRQLAYYDNLTGLANRRRFLENLSAAIASAAEDGEKLAVLYLDLDRFKEINDTMGHAAGDDLLRIVTRRLRQHVRGQDRNAGPGGPSPSAEIARLGGDEFAIILRELSAPEDAASVAQRILDVVCEPVWIGDQSVTNSVSIGISLYPRDGNDLDALVHNADSALYQAKAQGRNCFEFFQPVLNSAARRTSDIKRCLGQAVARDELELNYQPKVDLETSTVVGAEALLRWTNAELGTVSPAEFIPIAETAHLIVPIGAWVIEMACQQLHAWQDEGLRLLPVSVNVSGRQFAEAGFAHSVADSLRRHAVAPGLLEIELTETSLLEDTETTAECLRELRAMGLRISLDDFGTGHAALSYLTRIPLDTLKLDRTLVRDIDSDPAARGVTSAVITMAHSLGLKVVAEGLDHEDHVRALKELGCDQAQGFIFGAAVRADTFALWLSPDLGAGASPRRRRSPPRVDPHRTPRSAAPRKASAAATPPPPGPPAATPETHSLSIVRYALVIDDADASLGRVALDLTRLGVLVLYTRFVDEALLLADQERGNIRALVIAPETPLDPIPGIVAEIESDLVEGSASVVVIGAEPEESRRAQLREVGASWALWSPCTDEELRFVLNTAMALPDELARRRDPRAPVDLLVSLDAAVTPDVARIISLSAGGAFIQVEDPPAVGTSFRAGFSLGNEPVEVRAEVVHTNLRDTSLAPTFPRGVGVAFRELDPDAEDAIRELVKQRLARCAP